ncbi:MAG: pilus assembly protein PilM [Bacillales bacterium]|nr:pilus assembly protein PilM [Bacillales bacterium]
MKSYTYGKQKKLQMVITEDYLRLLVTKKNAILSFNQKALPEGLISGGMIEDEDSLLLMIEEQLSEYSAKKLPVFLCLPDGHTFLRKVAIPEDVPSDQIKGYLYMAANDSIPLPFEDPIIETVEWKDENKNGREALMIAAREAIVNQYARLLEKLKLKPRVMDLSILSLYRLYYHLNRVRPDDHMLLLQIHYSYVQLSIFEQHQPIYVHYVNLPANREAYINRSHMDYEYYMLEGIEDLLDEYIRIIVQEISRLQNFYEFTIMQGEKRLNKIVVAGDHPYLQTISEVLQEQMEMEIDDALTVPLFQNKENINIPPAFFDCIGLALRPKE